MTSLRYHRPQTLNEALELLKQGVPLAGGTRLTPNLRGVEALVDLQDLELDQIAVGDTTVAFGGTSTLQSLIDHAAQLPAALVQAARLEAGWNIRNQATVAGTIVTGDGRSPLLTVLLSLGTELEFAPGDGRSSLEETFARGADRTEGKLIISIHAAKPSSLRYEQVARSPADRPMLAVAASKSKGKLLVALGGFGAYPQVFSATDTQEASDRARNLYADAGDQWASAEYRSSAAAVLVARVFAEVKGS